MTKKKYRKSRKVSLDVETHPLEPRMHASKPRVRTSKPVEVCTRDLIAMICKAATERWPDDKSRPGIQIAHLPGATIDTSTPERRLGALAIGVQHGDAITSASWYVALHRYTEVCGQGRIVEFRTTNDDLDEALVDVGKYVAPRVPPSTHRKDLAKLLAGWISFICLMFVALCSIGCSGNVAGSTEDQAPTQPGHGAARKIETCDLVATTDEFNVFQFSDPFTVSPGGTLCTSWGGGVFVCDPSVCLVLPYTGSCPHCGGGGE